MEELRFVEKRLSNSGEDSCSLLFLTLKTQLSLKDVELIKTYRSWKKFN